MPQLDFATFPGQLFWLAVSFVILYILASRIMLPKIADVVEARAKYIADDIDKAETLTNQAEQAEKNAAKILAESSDKARNLIAESSSKAKAKMDTKRAELSEKLEQKIKKAEIEITKIEKQSIEVVDAVSAELSVEIANKILKAA